MHCSTCTHESGGLAAACTGCFAFSNYSPKRSKISTPYGVGFTIGKFPETITTKENDMKDIFITVGDKTYKPTGGSLEMSGASLYTKLELETCLAPHYEVSLIPTIKDVIFNPPATIVFWSDNTKTIVRAQGDDIYDPEKGIAMAYSKKMLGNKYDYYHTFAHYLKKWEKQQNGERI